MRRWAPQCQQRNLLILDRLLDGWTLRRTADEAGISMERVRQIMFVSDNRLCRAGYVASPSRLGGKAGSLANLRQALRYHYYEAAR